MKNRTWIIIFLTAAIVFSCLWLCVCNFSSPTNVAGIYQNGKLVKKIDLSTVTSPREITLKSENGNNVIIVSNGHIEMKSADCPDKICVKHGPLEKNGTPIVCLPNKIVIRYDSVSDDTDAKAGVAK